MYMRFKRSVTGSGLSEYLVIYFLPPQLSSLSLHVVVPGSSCWSLQYSHTLCTVSTVRPAYNVIWMCGFGREFRYGFQCRFRERATRRPGRSTVGTANEWYWLRSWYGNQAECRGEGSTKSTVHMI